jgi:acetylglutamate kinase
MVVVGSVALHVTLTLISLDAMVVVGSVALHVTLTLISLDAMVVAGSVAGALAPCGGALYC